VIRFITCKFTEISGVTHEINVADFLMNDFCGSNNSKKRGNDVAPSKYLYTTLLCNLSNKITQKRCCSQVLNEILKTKKGHQPYGFAP